MLIIKILRQRKEEQLEEEYRFERDLFINNPEMFDEYRKRKEDDRKSGNDGVTWFAPDSVEETEELMDIFADISGQLDKEEQAVDAEFMQKLGLNNLFDGIDIDEISDGE